MIIDINATNSATMEIMLTDHFISLHETINKQNEEMSALIKEIAKLQIIVIENESLKKKDCETKK